MNICKNCGNQFEVGEFCPNCGTKIEAPVVEQVIEANDNIINESIIEEKHAIDPGLSLGNISLILGIVALVSGTICSCVFACLGGLLPFVCAVVSIILSILALNKSKAAGFTNKKAIIGLILSIATIFVIITFVIFNGILGVAMRPLLDEIMYELY